MRSRLVPATERGTDAGSPITEPGVAVAPAQPEICQDREFRGRTNALWRFEDLLHSAKGLEHGIREVFDSLLNDRVRPCWVVVGIVANAAPPSGEVLELLCDSAAGRGLVDRDFP